MPPTPPPPVSIITRMSDVTRFLSAIEQGDAKATDQLLPLVCDEQRPAISVNDLEEDSDDAIYSHQFGASPGQNTSG